MWLDSFRLYFGAIISVITYKLCITIRCMENSGTNYYFCNLYVKTVLEVEIKAPEGFPKWTFVKQLIALLEIFLPNYLRS